MDMRPACEYAAHMSRMIQLRNVPDALHRKLKARAALEGLSLSEYVLRQARSLAERPTVTELRERLHRRDPLVASAPPARLLREERDRR